MAVTNFSPLLGLALPTTGDLSGTWGTTVNDSITGLLDSAVAGTTTLSTDADVTLTTTNGAANQARNAVLLCTGARTAVKSIIAPAQSKAYVVINSTSGGYAVKLVGAGPTVGITISSGEKCLAVWNGSDFVKISTTETDGVSTIDFGSTGLTPSTATSGAVTVAGTLAIANGGTGTTATTFVNLATNVTGTLPVANGGTGVTSSTGSGSVVLSTSPTLVTPVLGTPTSGNFSTGTFTWPTFNQNTSGTASNVIGVVAAANGGTGLSASGASGNFLQSNGSGWISTTITPGATTPVSSRTSNSILTTSDNSTLINVTSGTFTQTLTAAATLTSGWFCYYKNAGTGVVTIDPNGAELIGGTSTAVCNPGDVWLIQCTGTAFVLTRLVGSNSVIYTSGSNTFTVPSGVNRIYVECWGGGGGATTATGAGAGGYAAGWINTTPGATITGTVGAGGATSGSGGDGGSTSFSPFTANGGSGGVGGAANALGGTASGGTINISGGNGGSMATGIVSAFASGGAAPRGGLGQVGVSGGDGGIPGGGAAAGSGVVGPYTGGRGQINISWV